jgi:hypothetical protein
MREQKYFLSSFELMRSVGECFGYFFSSNEDINLYEIPFPDATKIQVGCYSQFTEETPDIVYTDIYGMRDNPDEDPNGDFYVWKSEIDRESNWLELILTMDDLIKRMGDIHHTSVPKDPLSCDSEDNPKVLTLWMNS